MKLYFITIILCLLQLMSCFNGSKEFYDKKDIRIDTLLSQNNCTAMISVIKTLANKTSHLSVDERINSDKLL